MSSTGSILKAPRTGTGRLVLPAAARAVAEGLVAVAVALTVRLLYDHPTAFVDEYYHLVAARSLIEGGTLSMNPDVPAAEPYARAWLFTYLIAGAYQLAGVSIAAGRLPGLLMAVLAVGVVFAWVRGSAGRVAAWGAALLTAGSMELVHYSAFARFYSMQTLCLLIAAAAAYALMTGPARAGPRVAAGSALLLAGALAMHTQATSAFALLPILGWAGLIIAWRGWHTDDASKRRTYRVAVLTAAGLGVLGVIGAWVSGELGAQWDRYRAAYAWAHGQRDNPWYYVDWLSHRLGWMLWVFPVAAAVALYRRPAPASLALLVVIAGLVGLSFGGMKAERYALYLLPFMFVVIGLGAGEAGRLGMSASVRLLRPVYRNFHAGRRAGQLARATAATALLLIAAYGVYRTPTFFNTYALLTGARQELAAYDYADWAAATPTLEDWLTGRPDAVLVTSTSPASLFHLRRVDYGLSVNQVDEAGGEEFAIDTRTGRPVIGTIASLETVMRAHAAGLIVVDDPRCWGQPGLVPPDVAAYIDLHAQPMDLPAGCDLRAYTWVASATGAITDPRGPEPTP